MLYPNQALNINVNTAAVPTAPTGSPGVGTYTTTIPQAIAGFNQVMMKKAERFDPFVQKSLIANPRFWYNMIPRGAFPNFNGYQHETRIFRGGLEHYAGLADWSAIDPNATDSNNPCKTGTYTVPHYAWERLQWSGFQRWWGSDPICLKQLQYLELAAQQLAWILQVGADYGISLQEVWNRDYLLYLSNGYDRGFVMTSEFAGNTAAPKFYYDPFQTHDFGDADGAVPFIVFPANVEVETLNFDVLDAVHDSLSIRCPNAAIGRDGGVPLFGLPVSHRDFERYIKGNTYELTNWREARPEKLISGLDLGVKSHRHFSLNFDENQLRFKIKSYIASYDSSVYGDVGSDLDGTAVFVARYVAPRIAGRNGETVNGAPAQIPEDNPEYLTAELAVAPIMLNEVFYNLMGTEINSLGSQTYFGPQSGLNGKWTWVNEYDKTENPERTIGNFRGKFEIFPKPSPNVMHALSFLYRRCTESLRSRCPVDNADVDPDTTTGAVAASFYVASASAAEIANDSLTVVVKLAAKLTDAGPGTSVTAVFTGGGGLNSRDVPGYVVRCASAPSYTLALLLSDLASVVAEDDAGETDYFVDSDGVLCYGTKAAHTKMVLSTVEG